MCAEVLNGCNYLIFGTQTRQDWYIYIYPTIYIYRYNYLCMHGSAC